MIYDATERNQSPGNYGPPHLKTALIPTQLDYTIFADF